ncbi:MAG: translocation/assembly module TamB domain-containing protein [Burkholderiales bacterium]|jgi:translocation and assembly module TamB
MNSGQKPSPEQASSVKRSSWPLQSRRWLGTWSLRGPSTLLGSMILMVLAWALWAWTGSEGSLDTTLKWVNRALPAHQTLKANEVQGNLRQGGRIGQLQWHTPLLQAHTKDAHIALNWSLLWRQPWPVESLQLQSLVIRDQRPVQVLAPWVNLDWPLPLQMSLKVGHFEWQGSQSVTLSNVQAQYAYDGRDHSLQVPSLTLAQGQYQLQARLQGAAPMALQVDVTGQVNAPTPGSQAHLALALSASAQGTLSGPQAQLAVTARLSPTPEQQATPAGTKAPHLSLQADVMPWQQPVIVQAHGQWQALDLAPLWPQAPQTHLNGHAQLQPDGSGWSLMGELSNLQAGAWDQHRLPLDHLTLQARHQEGYWQIQASQARLAGGQLQAQAQQSPAGWTGQMTLSGIVPNQLHTALTGAAIQGQVQAQNIDAGRIRFDAQLQAPALPANSVKTRASGSSPGGFHFEHLRLAGQWHQKVWQIDTLNLKVRQATLAGQFQFSALPFSLQGQGSLQLPGLNAQAVGHLAPFNGQGKLDLDVQDATQTQAWLQQVPAWAPWLKPLQASGKGQLQAEWQGGFSQAATPLKLSVQWPRLAWPTARQDPWVLESGQLHMAGTPLSWQAQWQSLLGQGQASSRLQAQWGASRPDLHSQQWSGLLDRFDLQAIGKPSQAPWRLQLHKAMAVQAQLGSPTLALAWSESSWQLQGPTPGSSRLQLDAGHWSAASLGQKAHARVSASWEDLPFNWLQSVWGTHVESDVLLHGKLLFEQNKDRTLTAQIRRSRGDLRFQTTPSGGPLTAAGLREANLSVRLHSEQLQADLLWDSEHMGQAQAQVFSSLSPAPKGWQWPDHAPLRGTVKVRLPKISAWSVLAPPGWRVQGNLDAQFDLAGTRSQPLWQGRLQADQLAVRSAVHGVAFDQGQLHARLQGQEMVLDRLSLRGAGPLGGEFLASGLVQLPDPSSALSLKNAHPLHAAKLNLQMEAKSLRVSNRADRRLVMSGQVTARMQAGQMQVRGQLKADQALFFLPDENTPSLGEDVLIVRPAKDTHPIASANPNTAPADSWLGIPDVRVLLDLGSDFRLQGKGLTTRLSGQVTLLSNTATQGLPRLNGEVRTVGGRYKAYGQDLNIQTGVLRFNGVYDNPGLEIIALRPHLPQSVGVQVSGTALLPRIRLYADPDMPDAEKLAWLVLGRSAASGGAESAVLQQAAMVLLSGNGKTLGSELASNLGLDEISVATSTRGGATGTALTLGKRLSQDFYLAYETSLSGTFGGLLIFYDLTQRLTLRAQAGEQSALDLIFRVRRD